MIPALPWLGVVVGADLTERTLEIEIDGGFIEANVPLRVVIEDARKASPESVRDAVLEEAMAAVRRVLDERDLVPGAADAEALFDSIRALSGRRGAAERTK